MNDTSSWKIDSRWSDDFGNLWFIKSTQNIDRNLEYDPQFPNTRPCVLLRSVTGDETRAPAPDVFAQLFYPAPDIELDSVWIHIESKREYRVLLTMNMHSGRENFPQSVAYVPVIREDETDGPYSRPIKRWYQRFRLKPTADYTLTEKQSEFEL